MTAAEPQRQNESPNEARRPGQGSNHATTTGPRDGARRAPTRRAPAAVGGARPDALQPPQQGSHAGPRAIAPGTDNCLPQSAAGARARTQRQGTNQAASAGLLEGAQDQVQHAPNASANNCGVSVVVGLGDGVPGAAFSGGPVGPEAAIHLRRYTQITKQASFQTIWQQIAMTLHTLPLPTSTTRLYRRCSVPPQATPSCRRLSSCRSAANSKSNPRTTREGTR
jgi:hypothetical protein